MFLIESDKQLQQLADSRQDIKLIFPVWTSTTEHELATSISFIYCRSESNEWIINLNHIDANTCSISRINDLVNSDTLVYGNRYLQTCGIDYEWAYFEQWGVPFRFEDFSEPVYKGFRNGYSDMNGCIPIVKWFEQLQRLPMPTISDPSIRRYSTHISVLGRIEESGLHINPEIIKSKHIHNGLVYTKYNPYTITGRPSNRHGGINWAALNKSDGIREGIISRWEGGQFIQMDYESYHIRLIARLIGYELPTDKTAHQYFAELYGVDYEEAKRITFRYLYGGMDAVALEIPFFRKVNEWSEKMWNDFVIRGYIETPVFKRRIGFKRIEEPSQQKVFNYLLQALETEVNYKKLAELVEYMGTKKSKIVLYTYDAILIDLHPNEMAIINEASAILSRGGFPVRTYCGQNYGELTIMN
jgi:hypothetical protein